MPPATVEAMMMVRVLLDTECEDAAAKDGFLEAEEDSGSASTVVDPPTSVDGKVVAPASELAVPGIRDVGVVL